MIFKNPDHRQAFIKCDNYALYLFLTSDVTIGEAFDAMKNYYTERIDKAIELGEDVIFTSFLRDNRDALLCLDDKSIRKEDVFIS